MEIQALPLADLRAMILEQEAVMHGLPDGPARDQRIAIVKGLRSRLPLYAEHRWQVREWRARRTRGHSPGPIVA